MTDAGKTRDGYRFEATAGTMGRDRIPEDMGRTAVFLPGNRNITREPIVVDDGIRRNGI